jgi:DNA (cytosine-5)-methyltransferase 1
MIVRCMLGDELQAERSKYKEVSVAGKLTVIDLFAGAGGLSLGFKLAGFEITASYDNWQAAVDTYRANFEEPAYVASITRDLDLPKATVIAGGPPCQGFSSAGMRRSGDERNTLVGEYARLIVRERPAAFVFENVEGFLTGARGYWLFELLDPLIEAGYRIHVRKVNAASYGVPQHRKRVICIGGLGWDPSFPETTHAAFGAPGAHLRAPVALPKTPTIAEAFRELPGPSNGPDSESLDHVAFALRDDDLKRAELLKPGQRMRDLPEDLWHPSYRKRAFRRVMDGTPTERRGGAPSGIRRLRPDQPSKAITGGALNEFIHPSENRPLTIRECATLQTFPVNFRFIGTRSERIQLIGNAVPPRLARVVAESLRLDLSHNHHTHGCGALLSFKPTLSAGMSPVLGEVTCRVRERYIPMDEPQRMLWR